MGRIGTLLLLGLAVTLCSCGGGGAAADGTDAPAALAALVLSPDPAPSLAVGATLQLTASPRDAAGNVLSGLPSATFGSGDVAIATVTGTGIVTGVTPGTTTVTAELTADGSTQHATVTITVVEAPPSSATTVTTPGTSFTPATLTVPVGAVVTWQFSGATHNVTFNGGAPPDGSIPDQVPGSTVSRAFPAAGTFVYECTRHAGMTGSVIVQGAGPATFTSVRLAPASASLQVGATAQLTATPLDQNGTAMAGLPAASYSSDNAAVATVSAGGLMTAVAAGSAVVTASITSGGVTHTATSAVTVTAQAGVTVTTPNNTFSPSSVTIAPGGAVTWQFSGATHNVTFSGPGPTGGNIPDQAPGNSVARTFATAGTYAYQCTRHSGMTGSVLVQSGGGGGTPPPVTGTPLQVTSSGLVPDRVEIAPGGVVTFQFLVSGQGIHFTSLVPAEGDIATQSSGASVSRAFAAVGDYDFVTTGSQVFSGRVRVR